ncbi:MAG: winged helix-turn-helix domain-containing protein, partial [Candidatus Puniceispirillaceae bacterium]
QSQLQLAFGQVILHPLLATLEFDGTTHTLRNRELRLLEIFFNSPEIYFTKEQLTDRLFSISESVTENAIEVYIGRLRKKLAGSNARIETVRGIGYRLVST